MFIWRLCGVLGRVRGGASGVWVPRVSVTERDVLEAVEEAWLRRLGPVVRWRTRRAARFGGGASSKRRFTKVRRLRDRPSLPKSSGAGGWEWRCGKYLSFCICASCSLFYVLLKLGAQGLPLTHLTPDTPRAACQAAADPGPSPAPPTERRAFFDLWGVFNDLCLRWVVRGRRL